MENTIPSTPKQNQNFADQLQNIRSTGKKLFTILPKAQPVGGNSGSSSIFDPFIKPKAEPQHEHRLFGLDLMRASSILIVLLAHTINVLSIGRAGSLIESYTADIGVELFFVLSGFLIGSIIIKMHNREEVTSFKSIKNFWIRRWFRTLPNYYLILAASVLVLAIGHHFDTIRSINYTSYLVFLQNVSVTPKTDFFGVSWSLTIEEWFYLLLPLVLFCVQFIIKSKPASLLFTIMLFIFLPLFGRIILASNNTNLEWDAVFRKLMPLRLDGIGIGVLSAFFSYYYQNAWKTYKKQLLVAGLLLFSYLMAGFYWGTINVFDFLSRTPVTWPMFSLKTYFFTLVDLSVAMAIPFISSIKIKQTNSFGKTVMFVSTISYSLYLVHPIINGLALHFFKGASPIFMFTSMWTFSILGAYVLHHVFEKRVTALRDVVGDKAYAVKL